MCMERRPRPLPGRRHSHLFIPPVCQCSHRAPPQASGVIASTRAGSMFLAAAAADELGSEGYTLTVTPRNIKITAAAAAGCFYGYQTL
ncbi:MAG: hypothetical protein KGY40_05955, partial [Thioalkalivibrio sp.]|nr:hypothetical protein [Thioalkalivibrio sp.]